MLGTYKYWPKFHWVWSRKYGHSCLFDDLYKPFPIEFSDHQNLSPVQADASRIWSLQWVWFVKIKTAPCAGDLQVLDQIALSLMKKIWQRAVYLMIYISHFPLSSVITRICALCRSVRVKFNLHNEFDLLK